MRQEMVAARQGSNAVSLLLAQLEAQRQGGPPAGTGQQAAPQGQERQQQEQQQQQQRTNGDPPLEAASPRSVPAGQAEQGWWRWR